MGDAVKTMLEIIVSDYKEILFNTVRIFSSVFEIVLAYILADSFYHSRLHRQRLDILPFAAVAAALIFIQENSFLTPTYRYVAECAVLGLLLFLLYTDPPALKAIGVMVFSVMVAASQFGAQFLYSIFTKYVQDEPEFAGLFWQLLKLNIANILLILLAIVVSMLSKHFRQGSTSLLLWTALLSVPAITLVTFSVFQYYMENGAVTGRMLPYIYASCAGLILTNVLVFMLFARLNKQLALKREKDMLESQLRQQEDSINRLETLYNRTRAFRHDIKNHILLLNVLAEQKKYDELRDYLREISGVIDESDYVRISGISVVDAILNEKMYEAQAKDITTSYDVFNLDKNDIEPLDLCIILSNALDNAIEANMTVADPARRYIKLKVHGNETFSVLSVSNPVDAVPKKNHAGKFLTSKSDAESHGFGLKSIENTAKKYNGEMLAKNEDGVFTLVVRLNTKKAEGRKKQ